jgi:membrane-associated protease RseP (regulator of RpoE activity)
VSEPGTTGRVESDSSNSQDGTWLQPGKWEDVPQTVPAISSPRRWWLHGLLFFLTLVTTTAFGFAQVESFRANRPLEIDWIADGYVRLAHADFSVLSGFQFSIPLLLILLAHEFGHYVACRRWKVDASLPFFLPSPTLFGTLGAFIRIRSLIYSRRSLFDIGVSGPLAGFAVLVPFLLAGIRLSRVIPGVAARGSVVFGTPLLLRVMEWVRFPGSSRSDILLHPMAMAAWAGLLATAINLLPMGQLDGGHIVYAAFGARLHRALSTGFVAILVLLGFVYWPWWFWAAVMFFFGRRHPLVYDDVPLDGYRSIVGVVALLLFLLSISIVPVYTR